MGKIMDHTPKQNEWLSLDSASRESKDLFKCETKDECLQYLLESAIKGNLQLSVISPMPVKARKGEFINHGEFPYRESSCFRPRGSTVGVVFKSDMSFLEVLDFEDKVFAYTEPVIDDTYPELEILTEVLDLAMVGNERIHVVNLYRDAIGKPPIDYNPMDGWYIKSTSGLDFWEINSDICQESGDVLGGAPY